MDRIPDRPMPSEHFATCFSDEGFVELFDCEFYTIEMQYPLLGMKHAEKRCFVRKEVQQRLIQAAKLLPPGFRFKILDAWRPFALQKELFCVYRDKIIEDFQLSEFPEDKKNEFISHFVSLPKKDRTFPPVHTTGGAIDLRIIDEKGAEIPMGTKFDEFSDCVYTSYFEGTDSFEVRDNRRLLYNAMIQAGFTNLPSEWWHYDYGDRFWASYQKTDAKYQGVFCRRELRK